MKSMKTSLKDWPKVYRKISGIMRDEDERIRLARSLAATPEQRFQMNTNCLKSLGLWGGVRSRKDLEARKAKLRRLEKPSLWRLQRSDEELARGRIFGAKLKIVTRCKS
jgi:hypothetical protein